MVVRRYCSVIPKPVCRVSTNTVSSTVPRPRRVTLARFHAGSTLRLRTSHTLRRRDGVIAPYHCGGFIETHPTGWRRRPAYPPDRYMRYPSVPPSRLSTTYIVSIFNTANHTKTPRFISSASRRKIRTARNRHPRERRRAAVSFAWRAVCGGQPPATSAR